MVDVSQAQETAGKCERGRTAAIESGVSLEPSRQQEAEGSTADQSLGRSLAGPIHRVYTVFNPSRSTAYRRTSASNLIRSGRLYRLRQILTNSGAAISPISAIVHFTIVPPIHPLASAACVHSPADYYGTALHELAHWSGHPLRLNRQTLNETTDSGIRTTRRRNSARNWPASFLPPSAAFPTSPSNTRPTSAYGYRHSRRTSMRYFAPPETHMGQRTFSWRSKGNGPSIRPSER